MVYNNKGEILNNKTVDEILEALLSIKTKLKYLPPKIQHDLVRAFSDLNVRPSLSVFGSRGCVLKSRPLDQLKREEGLEDIDILEALVNAEMHLLQDLDSRYQLRQFLDHKTEGENDTAVWLHDPVDKTRKKEDEYELHCRRE